MIKFLFSISIILLLIQSCGLSSNVTSNFSIQKRKYNKGWNVKTLFQNKQNDSATEVVLKSKNQEQDPLLVKNEKMKK